MTAKEQLRKIIREEIKTLQNQLTEAQRQIEVINQQNFEDINLNYNTTYSCLLSSSNP